MTADPAVKTAAAIEHFSCIMHMYYQVAWHGMDGEKNLRKGTGCERWKGREETLFYVVWCNADRKKRFK